MTSEDLLHIIGQNIVKFREKKGLKQIDLATNLNMEDSSLRRIEKGRTNPTILMLKKIADELDVKISDLLVE